MRQNDLGGFIIGIQGVELSKIERLWLTHPLVVGVILFSRNYLNTQQVKRLTASIKYINMKLLISVDHEGGRVQRFKEGFTHLPAMNALENMFNKDREMALKQSFDYGVTIAKELKVVGVDFSYAPVCDLNYQNNSVIGDRAFHREGNAVADLTLAFYQGLRNQKSIGVAKHFPGHGYVDVDTHLGIAYDHRSFAEIEERDLLPFKVLINNGIEAIMPAHIVYTAVDPNFTAVSSKIWLNYLRNNLNFSGLIISDDLDMKGAEHLGNITEKAQRCFNAGVDVLLCCNDFKAIDELLKNYQYDRINQETQKRIDNMSMKLQ